jgi:hypothetical protein
MAVAFGAGIGSGFGGTSDGPTVALTTTATVPAGGHIILAVKWYNNVTASVSGGGLTWVVDEQKNSAADSNIRIALISATAPSGLASGSTLTVTYSANAFARGVCGAYFTGVQTSSWEDAAGAGSNGTSNPWSGGAVSTATADTVVVGAAWIDFRTTTSTPLGSFSEAVDVNDAAQNNTMTMAYQIVSSTGSYTPSGNWASDGQQWVATAVAYKAGVVVDSTMKGGSAGMYGDDLLVEAWF